ncbi:hypothetical protein VHEMI05893 [[Torrubiella] hemipterigena]|uniref:Uncharacterized protein n=1 Tax=[Torrubiella] hemipterigena TaxID=1531966 RepID=A0A0A1TJV9_9HYPO|nr:hypothetical protein VHEMI05893 [[Torrubiella] hemipterigena]
MADDNHAAQPYMVTIDENIPWQSPHELNTIPAYNYLYNNTETPPTTRRSQSTASILHPRAFEDIFFERAYLLTTLSAQKLRVLDLLHRYARADFELANNYPGQQKRSLRKRRSLLRCKCDEAIQQEMNLSARLNQVEMELTSREERNKLRELLQQHPQQIIYMEPTPSLAYSTCTESTCETTQFSLLDARSPEFIPAAKPTLPTISITHPSEDTETLLDENAPEIAVLRDSVTQSRRWSLQLSKPDWTDD